MFFAIGVTSCTKYNLVASSTTGNNTAIEPIPADTTSGAIGFLALGDSYTIGASVEAKDRFPAQTKVILEKNGIQPGGLHYIAVSGWTSANLLSAIANQTPSDSFKIVTLLIGVNDQYRGYDITEYSKHFTGLLEKSITLAGGKRNHVFVLSIPDYSVTPFASGGNREQIRKEIDAFNEVNKNITLSYNISYIDITPVSREALNDPALIAQDGLHPSGKMYARWAEMLNAEIQRKWKQ
ncbi:MAG: SGNH/GDSL hydrolase family protein [Agriterribacter sp.]